MGFKVVESKLGPPPLLLPDTLPCPVCKGQGWRCRCFVCGGEHGLKPIPCTACGGSLKVPDRGGSGRVKVPPFGVREAPIVPA